MIYYIADLHFGHSNVIKFDNRPFSEVSEMDRVLIERWNDRVQEEDTVYIVGDLCHRSEHTADWYLKRLTGHKILILGNHDHPISDNPEALRYLEDVESMMTIMDGKNQIQLCHFPIEDWSAYTKHGYHVYGHLHNRRNEVFEVMKKKEHALNAGCMINDYTPVSFVELVRNNEIFRNAEDTTKERIL